MTTNETQRDLGGPRNLKGIHYQLLTSFLEVGSAVKILNTAGEDHDLSSITLVVEPRGGGDSTILVAEERRVQQIKTSTREWTVPSLSAGPFRNLFRAASTATLLEFVTDGGLRPDAEGLGLFLEGLSTGSISKDIFAPNVADDYQLTWWRENSTLAAFIEYLIERFAGDLEGEPLNSLENRDRITGFLGRLSIRANLSFKDQKSQCERLLLNRGIAPESIDDTIDQAVGSLLRRGKKGNQTVTFEELALELAARGESRSRLRFAVSSR